MEVRNVEVNLYPGDSKPRLAYYTDFLNQQNIRFKTALSYFGNKIIIYAPFEQIGIISSHSSRFIFDFYLKEAVASKIYDEYPLLNADDAGGILEKISETIGDGLINKSIYRIIEKKQSFNPSSYVLFNMKSIMTYIYTLTDELCQKFIGNIERKYLISVIKSALYNNENHAAFSDAEFSSLADFILKNDNNLID